MEEMTHFGEDVIVSLGKYFWSKKYKTIVKKGAKRTKEGRLKQFLPLIKLFGELMPLMLNKDN